MLIALTAGIHPSTAAPSVVVGTVVVDVLVAARTRWGAHADLYQLPELPTAVLPAVAACGVEASDDLCGRSEVSRAASVLSGHLCVDYTVGEGLWVVHRAAEGHRLAEVESLRRKSRCY